LSKIAENCDQNIDPRLGEFSPNCGIVYFGRFLKMAKVEKFRATFSTENLCINFDKKIGRPTFWAIFSNTILVTLSATPTLAFDNICTTRP
jgi:hypothetical protein